MLVDGRKRSGDAGDMGRGQLPVLHAWETRQDGLGWHVVFSGLRAALTLLPNPACCLCPVKLETVLMWSVRELTPAMCQVLALWIQ